MEKQKTVRTLESQKKELQDQIEDIQKSCKHPELKANFIQNHKGGDKKVMMVCTECDAAVRYPSSAELKDFCA
jgi:RNase P subunit RPR2